jgi:hypothetical protein
MVQGFGSSSLHRDYLWQGTTGVNCWIRWEKERWEQAVLVVITRASAGSVWEKRKAGKEVVEQSCSRKRC